MIIQMPKVIFHEKVRANAQQMSRAQQGRAEERNHTGDKNYKGGNEKSKHF